MVLEDFLTYQEVDATGNTTVTANEIHCNPINAVEVTYVRKDMGAGHFSDFEHKFECEIADWSVGVGTADPMIWALNNGATTYPTMLAAGIDILTYHANMRYDLREEELNNYDNTPDQGDPNTRWWTVKRTGTTLTAKLYSDATRTTLVDTLTVVCATTTYQYIAPLIPYTWNLVTNQTELYIRDLDLQEGVESTLHLKLGLGGYGDQGGRLKRIAVRHHTHNRMH